MEAHKDFGTGMNRRSVLAAIGAALSLSQAWIEALGQTKPRPRDAEPAGSPGSSRWSARAVEGLRRMQETAYVELGRRMGIAGDAASVYRELTRERMPAEYVSPERFRRSFGDSPASPTGPDAVIRDYLARYGNVRPPTPFEDPNLYAVLLEMADAIEAVWRSRNFPAPPRVLLGTLPTATVDSGSGLINAETIPVDPGEYLIVFQRGLFDFAFEMSKVAASAFPPIDVQRGEFTTAPGPDVQRSPAILEQFNAILHAYLVLGESRAIAPYVIDDSHVPTAAVLLRSLELFVLGHEYGHAMTAPGQNLGTPPRNSRLRESWDREYGADQVGLSLMYGAMGDLSLTFWAPVHFFACMEMHRRALSTLARGTSRAEANGSHPPPLLRAQYLRTVIREFMPGPDTERAIRLADQLQAFWDGLWRDSETRWLQMRRKKVRPSEIWVMA